MAAPPQGILGVERSSEILFEAMLGAIFFDMPPTFSLLDPATIEPLVGPN